MGGQTWTDGQMEQVDRWTEGTDGQMGWGDRHEWVDRCEWVGQMDRWMDGTDGTGGQM